MTLRNKTIAASFLMLGVAVWFYIANMDPPLGAVKTPLQNAEACVASTGKLSGCIEQLDAEGRATLKGAEMAKVGVSSFSDASRGIRAQIVAIEPIAGGVQVYARAWSGQKQLGFGDDGSVEIERFRFFNPPVLVHDGTTTAGVNSLGEKVDFKNYKEDSAAALSEILADAIRIVGRTGTKIEIGKVGRTVDTYYPDASPETSSVDGRTGNEDAATWTASRDATDGTYAEDSTGNVPAFSTAVIATLYYNTRGFFLFNTAALPDTDSISAVTLSLYREDTGGSFQNANTTTVEVVSSSPASNTAITTADYDQRGTTSFSSLAFASTTNNAYFDMSMNASGIANVSKTGVSKFAAITGRDFNNSAPTGNNRIAVRFAEAAAGTTTDPKLTVTHAVAVAAGAGQQVE